MEEYLGSEMMEPDGYLQPTRFKITCKCLRCGLDYSWITTKPTTKDRPCPKKACKEAVLKEQWERESENMRRILETQTPPGHIGANPAVNAVDITADIVMKDHNLTNLQDNLRPGDTMAPKLPPAAQKQADNFFTKNPLADRGVGSRQAELLRRRALAGAFRNMAVSPTIVGGQKGESPLRHVRTERFDR